MEREKTRHVRLLAIIGTQFRHFLNVSGKNEYQIRHLRPKLPPYANLNFLPNLPFKARYQQS